MPYMNCNGITVSRNSSTAEVKKCKEYEAIAHKQAYQSCTDNKECREDRAYYEGLIPSILVVMLLILVAVLIPLRKIVQ